jgi:LexA-binding, inner membrane-associated putative hydrolase
MRSLPHIAIGCATVWAGARLLGGLSASTPPNRDESANGMNAGQSSASPANAVDFRLVAAASLLPDMVDRALTAGFGVRKRSPHQHLLGHTLAFNAPIIFAGVSLMRRTGDPRLLSVAGAAMTHVLVDPVIRSPRTLLWPLFGLEFPDARGLNRPLTALTQIAAALTIAAATWQLARSGRLGEFITNGRL